MKKLTFFSLICFVFPIFLTAQQLQEVDEYPSSQITEDFQHDFLFAIHIQPEFETKEFLAPKPHYTHFGDKRYELAASIGISQPGLRMNKAELIDEIAKASPLVHLSLFKHKRGLSFQSGLGISLHRFEVETISVSERQMDFMLLEIPLMARLHLTPSFYATGGLVPAFNLRTRSDFDFNTGRPDLDDGIKTKHDTVKNAISNVRICAGYLFPSGLLIQASYTKALSDVFEEGWDEKSFGYVDLQIGYALFAKRRGR